MCVIWHVFWFSDLVFCFPPWFRNHIMFRKRESANERYPWFYLKQSNKSGKMLRSDIAYEFTHLFMYWVKLPYIHCFFQVLAEAKRITELRVVARVSLHSIACTYFFFFSNWQSSQWYLFTLISDLYISICLLDMLYLLVYALLLSVFLECRRVRVACWIKCWSREWRKGYGSWGYCGTLTQYSAAICNNCTFNCNRRQCCNYSFSSHGMSNS